MASTYTVLIENYPQLAGVARLVDGNIIVRGVSLFYETDGTGSVAAKRLSDGQTVPTEKLTRNQLLGALALTDILRRGL